MLTYRLKTGKINRSSSLKWVFATTFCLILAATIFSCTRIDKNKELTEGIIEYKVFYLNTDSVRFDPDIRPDCMVVKFKENNTVNRVEALSGAFSFAFIQDLDSKTSVTLVKIFNKKLFYKEPLVVNSCHFAYKSMPSITIEYSDETEEFLGFQCKKALATFNDSIASSFEIWYTDEIKVNNPNHNTPFEAIDGIMLKFSVIMFNHRMNIVATAVKPATLPKDEFVIPFDYEEVDYDTMMELIYLFQ
ncbi:MAG TPA: hypothetical protein PKL52_05755 [Tenuifilaceae bacterium]|nr:hypothetical protein [Tenuifilaceae bacterium]